MKKFLAILLSAVLCAAAAYTAIAVEEDPTGDNVAVEETPSESGSVSDLVAALEGDTQAQQIADNIESAVKNGATQADVNALLVALADYINGQGYDVADLKNKTKAKQFVGDFLEDCGVDSEALGKAIDGIDQVSDQLFGSSDNSSDTGADYGSASGYESAPLDIDYGVESTTIPQTGELN